MNRWLTTVAILLGAGCSPAAPPSASPPAPPAPKPLGDVSAEYLFTAEYAAALRKALPGADIRVNGDLKVEVLRGEKVVLTARLDNPFDMVRGDPAAKDEILRQFVASIVETTNSLDRRGEGPDRTRIVPIVKDAAWIEDMRAQMKGGDGGKGLPGFEPLGGDLILLYAEDSPSNLMFLSEEKIRNLGLDRKELRELACRNLARVIPEVTARGSDGVYVLTAGGSFEASLVLLDSVWTKKSLPVKGDFVFAVPSRDLLLVTGSEDADGIRRVRKVVAEVTAGDNAYLLSSRLHVRRDGVISAFEP